MYTTMIRETAAKLGFLGTDAAQVEAWMRLECGTLDWLSRERFRAEVKTACEMVRDYPAESARLAEVS